jgi:NADPH:quinone reductase-like Zn-dependent oxidoreductase
VKALVRRKYGLPEVLEVEEIQRPALTDDGVLVRVRAASVNPYDWHMLTGVPYMARVGGGIRGPKTVGLGVDFAGTVEAVGKEVTEFRVGDDVFGTRSGALAEYVVASKTIAHKPANLTFEEAAAVPLAALTALQALREKGRIKAGHRVLVNGASGGVGTFAVQLAKWFGAEVTAVCSSRNVETARSLGADHVIDYTKEDFTRSGERYDVLLDIGGTRSWSELKRTLADNGVVVAVGGPKQNRWVGPLALWVGRRLASVPGSRTVALFLTRGNKEDLRFLAELLEAGTIKPVIEKTYAFEEAPDALRYVGQGHAQGKLVVTV